MKKTVWIAIAFVVLFLVFVVSTTFQGERVGVEVCMAFRGQRDCRKAQAEKSPGGAAHRRHQRVRAAGQRGHRPGQCENTPPESVNWR